MEQDFREPINSKDDLYERMSRLYGTQELARESFRRILWPNGFQCRKCKATEARHLEKRDLEECRRCKTQHSITSGTFMHGSTHNLAAWAAVIFFHTHPWIAPERDAIIDAFNISERQIRRWHDILDSKEPKVEAVLNAFRRDFYSTRHYLESE